MAGNEVVLGLLLERPGTSYDLERRLKERFGSAGFGRGTARHAIKRLADNGLIDITHDRPAAAGPLMYGATPAGIEHFRGWITSSIPTPPIREELHAKIALCKPAQLLAMIQVVREAEKACMVQLQGLQWRMQDRQHSTATRDWAQRMDLLVKSGDVAWWDGRIKWLQKVRIFLEKERQRYEAERPSTD
jgi:DNA-binding PadR family transcriptional regulator